MINLLLLIMLMPSSWSSC